MSNHNLQLPAYPCEQWGNHNTREHGLTKHEYAALIIAQGMAASDAYNIEYPYGRSLIAQRSYELAAEVLNQFK